MKITNRLAVVCLFAISGPGAVRAVAQSDSLPITTTSHLIGIGETQVLDTYLSQEHFCGLGLSYLASIECLQPGRHWNTLTEHEANLSLVNDRAESGEEIEGSYNFYWAWLRSWRLAGGRLRLQAGGAVNATLGFIYNTSNSNNPAQARAALQLMPTGVASYHFSLWHLPMRARYELLLPLAGLHFSPNYGQSYYEIFARGNYDHNIVPTTFAAAPEFRQLLTLDVQLGRSSAFRIGYLGNYQQTALNHLKRHVYTHRLLIGYTQSFSIIPRTL